MVTKLDRFVRNTVEAIQVVQKLFNKKIAVHILNIGIIEDTPTGRLTFNIFSDFRNMIVTRTQEGKMYARMHNLSLIHISEPTRQAGKMYARMHNPNFKKGNA